MQDDPQATIADDAAPPGETDPPVPEKRVVGTRAGRTTAHRTGRPRVTGAAADAPVVAEDESPEPAPVAVVTGSRGSRGASRTGTAKGSGTARDARTGTTGARDDAASATTAQAETPPAVPKTRAPKSAARQARPAPAEPESTVTAAVHPAADESADSPVEPAPRAGSRSGIEGDTAASAGHPSSVDENTGSRQRIRLFGRRRGTAAARAIESAKEDDRDGSDLLAELVREAELIRETRSEDEPAQRPRDETTARRVEESQRTGAGRGTRPIEPESEEQLVETVDRASLVRDPDTATSQSAQSSRAERGTPRARRAAETRVFPPARPAPPATAPVVLAVTGLHKRYGDVVAVDGVNLSVRAGSLYGIVGPNGAGKTTTLSIITGLLRADSGTVYVDGIDVRTHPRNAKRAIGVLPDHLRTFDRLTGAQLLYYAGTLRGLDAATTRQRSADLAAAFGIEDAMGRLVADYSAGMSKKVCLAAAMIHAPRLLVLDEPFEGVDPVSAATVTGILQRYVDAGGTVLLSSHGMDLVQRVCDSVAIIVGGVVLDSGPVDEVRGEKTLEDRFIELAGGRTAVEGLEWLHSFSD